MEDYEVKSNIDIWNACLDMFAEHINDIGKLKRELNTKADEFFAFAERIEELNPELYEQHIHTAGRLRAICEGINNIYDVEKIQKALLSGKSFSFENIDLIAPKDIQQSTTLHNLSSVSKPDIEHFELTEARIENWKHIQKRKENLTYKCLLAISVLIPFFIFYISAPDWMLSNSSRFVKVVIVCALLGIPTYLLLLTTGLHKYIEAFCLFWARNRYYSLTDYKKICTNYENYQQASLQYENTLKLEKEKELKQLRIKEQLEQNDRKEKEMQLKEHWLNLNGWAFEKETGLLFEQCGFRNVRVTKGSGDGGVDIIMTRDGKKYIVQCKKHAKPAPQTHLRDLFGAFHDDENADKAIFICTGGFTADAIEFALNNEIDLIDLEKLLEIANSKTYSSLSSDELRLRLLDTKIRQKEAYKRHLWWKNKYS